MRVAAALVIAMIVTGCAMGPTCDPHDAAADALARATPAAELHARYPGCGDGLDGAYAAAVSAACDVPLAWQAARSGITLPHECADPGNRLWPEAVRLAEQLNGYEQELAQVESRLDAGEGESGSLRLERVRLIREIDQLRGVAAIRGWETRQPGG